MRSVTLRRSKSSRESRPTYAFSSRNALFRLTRSQDPRQDPDNRSPVQPAEDKDEGDEWSSDEEEAQAADDDDDSDDTDTEI
jgi:hypothetical protein